MSGIKKNFENIMGKEENAVSPAFSPAVTRIFSFSATIFSILPKTNTVKLVLETTCIKGPPALRDHCSDTSTLLKNQPNRTCIQRPPAVRDHFHYFP